MGSEKADASELQRFAGMLKEVTARVLALEQSHANLQQTFAGDMVDTAQRLAALEAAGKGREVCQFCRHPMEDHEPDVGCTHDGKLPGTTCPCHNAGAGTAVAKPTPSPDIGARYAEKLSDATRRAMSFAMDGRFEATRSVIEQYANSAIAEARPKVTREALAERLWERCNGLGTWAIASKSTREAWLGDADAILALFAQEAK